MPAGPAAPPRLDLEDLARARFEDLSDAELKLLRAAPKGELAVCGPNAEDDDAANDPSNGDTWGAERAIHAELMRWLARDREAAERVDPKGLQIYGAKITGQLDLSLVVVPFALVLARCRLMENLSLTNAQIPVLALPGCRALSLTADRINVKGGIYLRQGFHAHGEVRLLGAQIGGDLDCSEGWFVNPLRTRTTKGGKVERVPGTGMALNADGINVKGSVFLRQGFHAQGEVRLLGAKIGGDLDCTSPNPGCTLHCRALGAKIGGDLDCTGSRFENPPQTRTTKGGKVERVPGTGTALNADGINVKGSAFLSGEFHAQGEVRLVGAKIGGVFSCIGGGFENPPPEGVEGSGRALSADGINVKGGVFLQQGFHAQGEVRLPGAQIASDLSCIGGTFTKLTAQTATITGNFVWCDVRQPEGAALVLDLMNASAGSIADDKASWPAPGNLLLDGFVYKRISEGPRDAKTRLEWLGLQKPFTPQPYRQLAKVLGEEGDPRGAREVLYEMEKALRREDAKKLKGLRRWAARGWSGLLRLTIGYGYRTGTAFLWLVILVILGTLLYRTGEVFRAMTPTEKEAYSSFRGVGQRPPS